MDGSTSTYFGIVNCEICSSKDECDVCKSGY